MLISIITVVLNREETIEKTILSVLTQSYKEFEYIIVDGASVDKTMLIVKDKAPLFTGKLKWMSEPDSGIYEAMNRGLRIATGDVVGFLNSDDMFRDETVLEEIAASFDKKYVDAVYGNVLYRIDNSYRIIRKYSGRFFYPQLLRYGVMPPHPSFYARRECYLQAKGYNEDFKISGDFELLLRMFLKDRISYRYLNKDMVIMKIGGASGKSAMSVLRNNTKEILKACRINEVYTNELMITLRFLIKIWGVLKWLLIPRYV